MKSQKAMVAVAVLLAVFVAAGCGSKYSDAVELSEKQLKAMETYTDNLENVDSKEDIITAMNDFGAKMENLMAEAEGLRKKYPELYEPGAEMPEAFAEIEKKTEAVISRMTAASMKTMQYMMDPEVQKAMMRMNSAMMSKEG